MFNYSPLAGNALKLIFSATIGSWRMFLIVLDSWSPQQNFIFRHQRGWKALSAKGQIVSEVMRSSAPVTANSNFLSTLAEPHFVRPVLVQTLPKFVSVSLFSISTAGKRLEVNWSKDKGEIYIPAEMFFLNFSCLVKIRLWVSPLTQTFFYIYW